MRCEVDPPSVDDDGLMPYELVCEPEERNLSLDSPSLRGEIVKENIHCFPSLVPSNSLLIPSYFPRTTRDA